MIFTITWKIMGLLFSKTFLVCLFCGGFPFAASVGPEFSILYSGVIAVLLAVITVTAYAINKVGPALAERKRASLRREAKSDDLLIDTVDDLRKRLDAEVKSRESATERIMYLSMENEGLNKKIQEMNVLLVGYTTRHVNQQTQIFDLQRQITGMEARLMGISEAVRVVTNSGSGISPSVAADNRESPDSGRVGTSPVE